MKRLNINLSLFTATLLGLSCAYQSTAYAATAMDLSHQQIANVQALLADSKNGASIHESRRMMGSNSTLHVRFQQTYQGYPVFGADGVLHIPNGNKNIKDLVSALKRNNGSMDGTIYQSLQSDLINTPAIAFTDAQANKAMTLALDLYQQKIGTQPIVSQQDKQLIVYVDKNNKAHFAFKVSFFAEPAHYGLAPEKPTYILDAVSMQEYLQWNDARGSNQPNAAQLVSMVVDLAEIQKLSI